MAETRNRKHTKQMFRALHSNYDLVKVEGNEDDMDLADMDANIMATSSISEPEDALIEGAFSSELFKLMIILIFSHKNVSFFFSAVAMEDSTSDTVTSEEDDTEDDLDSGHANESNLSFDDRKSISLPKAPEIIVTEPNPNENDKTLPIFTAKTKSKKNKRIP